MYDIVYTVNESKIKDNISKLKTSELLGYSLSDNDSFEVIRLVDKYLGKEDCYLISSISEFSVLNFCGISPDRIIFTNVLSTNSVRQQLYALGVRKFVFCDYRGVSRFTDLYKDIDVFLMLSDNKDELGITQEQLDDCITLCKYYRLPLCIYLRLDSSTSYNKYLSLLSDYNVNFKFILVSCKDSNNTCYSDDCFMLDAGKYILEDAVDCKSSVLYKTKYKVYLSTSLLGRIHKKNFTLEYKGKVLSRRKCNSRQIKVAFYGSSGYVCDFIGDFYMTEEDFDSIYSFSEIVIKDIGFKFNKYSVGYMSDVNLLTKVIKGV